MDTAHTIAPWTKDARGRLVPDLPPLPAGASWEDTTGTPLVPCLPNGVVGRITAPAAYLDGLDPGLVFGRYTLPAKAGDPVPPAKDADPAAIKSALAKLAFSKADQDAAVVAGKEDAVAAQMAAWLKLRPAADAKAVDAAADVLA